MSANRRPSSRCLRGERDHVGIGELAPGNLLAISIDALMHVGHELVEMRAALVFDRACLEEQVHQHGLATPDFAMDIEAARRPTVLVREQPAEQPLLAGRLVADKPLLEICKGFRDLGLGGIGLDRT